MDQDCLSEQHMAAVIEQLEKVIEVIKDDPEKAVGLKVTSFIEQASISKSEERTTPEPLGNRPSFEPNEISVDTTNVC